MLMAHHTILTAQLFVQKIDPLIFPDGNIFHFCGDDSLFSIVHLRNIATWSRFVWFVDVSEPQVIQFGICQSLLTII
ncbi:hypothetical protein D3C85_1557800 [compost metagenome]